jgi:hypothetical protein
MFSSFAHKTAALKSVYLAFLLWMAGGGSICPGEEIIILGKHKTEALAEWGQTSSLWKGSLAGCG